MGKSRGEILFQHLFHFLIIISIHSIAFAGQRIDKRWFGSWFSVPGFHYTEHSYRTGIFSGSIVHNGLHLPRELKHILWKKDFS